MRTSPRQFAVLAFGVIIAACGGQAEKKPEAVAQVEHYTSAGGKFSADLPGDWKGSYRAIEHPDTLNGARFGVEFVFKPEPGSKAPPQTLAVIRIFPRDVWDKLAAQGGPPIAAKLLTKGEDVYTISLPKGNPYKPGTPEATRFDKLVIGLIDTPPKITPL